MKINQIIFILVLIVTLLSIGTTCMARMTEEEPNDSEVMLDSSTLVAEKEEAIAPKTIDSKLVIGAIILIILIVIIIITLVVIRNKRKMK